MTQSAMKSIDMHCDTLMHAYFHHGEGVDIYHMPEAMVDVRRLREGGALAQFFAIFVPSRWEDRDWHGREPVSQEEYIRGCVRILERTIRAHGDIMAPALRARGHPLQPGPGKAQRRPDHGGRRRGPGGHGTAGVALRPGRPGPGADLELCQLLRRPQLPDPAVSPPG